MFKYIEFYQGDLRDGYYDGTIKMIDDDFECNIKNIEALEIDIIKEYSNRNKNTREIGKNLALFVLYYTEYVSDDIKETIEWQDRNLPDYIKNWSKFAEERDYWLNKFLTWS